MRKSEPAEEAGALFGQVKMLRGTIAGQLKPANIPRFLYSDQLISGDALCAHYP